MELDADTLERLVPDRMDPADVAGVETLKLHMERYHFAAGHARPGRLLDIACGVGYGTRILVDEASGVREAIGVDLSDAAVDYALGNYAKDGLTYRQCDAMIFSDPEGFDTIVSLETVEHLPDPHAFFQRVAKLVKPGGVLVSSVPTTPSVDLNPHHLHDFTAADFHRMGREAGLTEIASLPQIQQVQLSDLWSNKRFKRDNLRSNLVGYYLNHPGAFFKRVGCTLSRGLSPHYLTLAWQRPA